MEFKEINTTGDMVQQIGRDRSFADIEVDTGNGNYLYSNVNLYMLYEDTLEDIENMLGHVPGFMKLFPKEGLVQDWPSWKGVGEMDMDRARYLLSTDEMLEGMLSKTHG
jgi:hypothetical protein